MKIGIDLDDVVFEFVKPLLEFYKKKYGGEILFEDVFSYDFSDVFKISLEEVIDLIGKNFTRSFIENLNLCEFSKESILKLAENHELFFITSRLFREGTKESLDKHFLNTGYNLVYSSNPYAGNEGKTKAEICEELNIDFMIEDCKRHSKICAENGIKVFLIDKPWNQKCGVHGNIIRVKNWKEIITKLNEN